MAHSIHPHHNDQLSLSTALPQSKDVRIIASRHAIIKETVTHDVIVVHSTEQIKTFIAIETIKQVGLPVVFIVPESTSVPQHANSLRQCHTLDVQPFFGDMHVPASFDVLVTTPKAFDTARLKYGLDFLQWHRIKCVVFDDVHQLVKHQPYRQLALNMRREHSQPHVLALSQVWAGGIDRETYKRLIESVSNDLRVDRIRVALDDEGHQSKHASSCFPSMQAMTSARAKPPQSQQKPTPMPMLQTFMSRVEARQATPLSCILTQCVLLMELLLSKKDDKFSGCMLQGKGVKEWSVYVHEQKCMLIKEKHDLAQMYSQLDFWYEALRQLVISHEQDVFLAVLYLRMFHCDKDHAKKIWSKPVQRYISEFWTLAPSTFPRLEHLRDILLAKSGSRGIRGHLLVKKKVAAHVVEYFIAHDEQLGFYYNPACLYAPTTDLSGTFCMSKQQFDKRLKDFASGTVNLLITTNVSIEGANLEPPEWVLKFSDIQAPSSEALGSCNNAPKKSCAANTAGTVVTVAPPYAASKDQFDSRDSVFPRCSESSSDATIQNNRTMLQKMERRASEPLIYGHITLKNVLFKLNLFCRGMGVVLQERTEKAQDRHFWTCMTYKSEQREVTGSACGSNKTESRRLAATVLVDNLRNQMKNEKD